MCNFETQWRGGVYVNIGTSQKLNGRREQGTLLFYGSIYTVITNDLYKF